MQIAVQRELAPFAFDVLEGLTKREKSLPPRYFYDDLGSALFQAITLLPEYGLTRADERLLETQAPALSAQLRTPFLIAELGSGDGSKTSHLLRAAGVHGELVKYCPIDISPAALEVCRRELEPLAHVRPILGDYFTGLRQVRDQRTEGDQLLVLFLGSTIGNFDREAIPEFLETVRGFLKPGDLFLLGADLVKPEESLIAAYDDSLGVTAAFNLNLLRRINTELGGNFNLRAFRHQAFWNGEQHRIEIHLISSVEQVVFVEALQLAVTFREGESIWTESCHKFSVPEVEAFGLEAGFEVVTTWTDQEWPFAESLWRAR
ncbi:MAG: L-histidine N(alpha)-methyltransferase [Bryobacteraceae bacterium]